MNYLMGIDMGTTATKIILIDLEGHVVSSVEKPPPCFRNMPVGRKKMPTSGGEMCRRVYPNASALPE
jgi:sugar (pentulose or hexulose) kinase